MDEIVFVISVSEAHNRSNVRRSVAESFADLARLLQTAPRPFRLRLNLATCFDCPFEGRIDPERVLHAVEQTLALTPELEFGICDTTGRAFPDHVRNLMGALLSATGRSGGLRDPRPRRLASASPAPPPTKPARKSSMPLPAVSGAVPRTWCHRQHRHGRPRVHLREHGHSHRHRPRSAACRRRPGGHHPRSFHRRARSLSAASAGAECRAGGLGRHRMSPAHRFDLLSLRLFIATAETGAIARAADACNIAPSAVSKRIAHLEVTGRGRALLSSAARHRAHARRRGINAPCSIGVAVARAYGRRAQRVLVGRSGVVRLSGDPSAIIQFLPEDLDTFMRLHPSVQIRMHEDMSVAIFQAVREGLADVGIYSSNVPADDLATAPYRRDTLVVVVPSGHPLAAASRVTLLKRSPIAMSACRRTSALQALLRGKAPRSDRSDSGQHRGDEFRGCAAYGRGRPRNSDSAESGREALLQRRRPCRHRACRTLVATLAQFGCSRISRSTCRSA